MDSKEILQQYIVGAMKSQSAIAELEKNLVDTSDFLNGADIVLTATDDRELNQKIVSACRMRKILVNTADDKSLCDFYFPAVTEKDGVVIGMNSGGKSPKTVRKVREYLEKYR